MRRLPRATCATSRKRCLGTPEDVYKMIRKPRCLNPRQLARQVHIMTGVPCAEHEAWGRWLAIPTIDKQRAILRGGQ